MGGKFSVDFLAPSGSGENMLVTCENGDYAADVEIARGDSARRRVFPSALGAPEEVETPGVTTIEALAEFLGDRRGGDVEGDAGREGGRHPRARARPRRRPARARRSSSTRSPARRGRRPTTRSAPRSARPAGRSARSASTARSSPTRRCATGSSSPGRTATAGTCAASRRGATSSRASPTSASRARATAARSAAATLQFQTAIEVGHIFNFGAFYSTPLEATFLDEDGQEKPLLGGSYGIGPGRVMAAVVEQSHDEHGIVWPAAIAPYDVHVVVLARRGGDRRRGGRGAVGGAGREVLLDDRDQRPGEKFADADLIGIPIRVTAGKKSLEDGAVDVRDRENRGGAACRASPTSARRCSEHGQAPEIRNGAVRPGGRAPDERDRA